MSESQIVESVTVEIEAPARFVWEVLVDYPRYPEWNPYTVRAETTLRIGDRIDLTVPAMDGSAGTFVNREYIRVVDPPHHLRYDTGDELPGIFAVRDQWIESLGPRRCSYRTTDTFSGEHAGQVMRQAGPWVKEGFDAVARALKARAERLWSPDQGPAS
ncbi:SRPBCC domain-containing protein [Amycolatopsis cihanbeyliensis]|uniref:Polyketide cyclase/dehydrase/lipid transport protein n=1 Tax=Amycolatopsis cihanbeyliensis TaxID=1128664 RepID=A0A542DQC5_AMYCI|nr:SRPBCC domain-containing protein [Amycolatopsis cihanbeyliensis]TQJ05311.1 polyketide cyclase/dehydrase/lipid transport protein [Amycolatopsis cihanbeyliensis]